MRGLKYVSFYREIEGFSRAAVQYIEGFLHRDVALTWHPMVPDPRNPYMLNAVAFEGTSLGLGELDRVLNRPVDYDVVLLHLLPELYPRWIEREPGKKYVGYLAWETDKIPVHWPRILERLDLVLVPSTWNKQVLEASGLATPVVVIPHILQEWKQPVELWPRANGLYVFYTIGAWTHRKSMYLTLQSYLEAFDRSDPTLLVIKSGRQDLTKFVTRRYVARFMRTFGTVGRAVRKMRRNYRHAARVLVETRDLSEARIFGLHRRGDCYVAICRAEGWGLPAFEAAGQGNPVIMTNYGGQLDFLPRDLSYLVDYRMIPVNAGIFERFYQPDQNWTEPDKDHAIRTMRKVFENQPAAREKGRELQGYVHEHFSETAVMDRLLAALRSL